MHPWRSGRERRAAVGDHRERLVVDVDQRCGILGDVAIFRDHDCDRFADVHGFVSSQRRAIQVLLVGPAGKTDDETLGAQVRHQIGQREDGVRAGHRECGALVDAAYCSMAVRAAHERGLAACPAAGYRR